MSTPADKGLSPQTAASSDKQRAADGDDAPPQLLQDIIDAFEASIAVVDAGGRIILVNRAWGEFARNHGLQTPEAAVGANYLDVCRQAPGAEAAGAAEALERILVGEAHSFCFDYTHGASGAQQWFQMRLTRLELLGTSWAVIAHEEVTDRRCELASLRVSEGRYRSIFHASSDALTVYDGRGRIVDANPAACRLTGYSYKELTSLTGADLVTSAYRGLFERFVHDPSSVAFPLETTAVRKDGARVVVEVTGAALDDADEPRLLTVVRDITQRKRLARQEQKLAERAEAGQKLESLGALAGGVAHDFNNLLAAVLGSAELALAEMAPTAAGREHLEDIRQASMRASELTGQMLTYAGQGPFAAEPVDLNALIEGMRELLTASISKQALLELELAASTPTIQADPGQIRQVVMNLASNASDALGERGGVVTIRTRAAGAGEINTGDLVGAEAPPAEVCAGVAVSDNGCGMDAETRRRIFEPFFTTKFTGRGLGMAAVLGVVRGHAGALRVDSRPGVGSTIEVFLPAAPTADRVESVVDAAENEGKTVLVIDDEASVRKVAAAMLARNGFTVLTAANGEEGIDLFDRHADRIAVVLLDRTMPGLDGEATFRRLRELRPDVRVVLCSGYAEGEAAESLPRSQLAGYIQKPFPMRELVETLRSAAAGAEA